MAARTLIRPAGFVIAGMFFLFPFIAVSCEVPGGYGRAAPGGTTVYTGLDLAVGGEPDVEPDSKEREGPSQALDPQPLAILALLVIAGGIVLTLTVNDTLRRRAAAALTAGGAALLVVTNQLTVQTLLQHRVPSGKDYVNGAEGFGLCLFTLLLTMGLNSIGWIRSASRR
ncbi:hypothetical protein [Allorhizocola rhizosphaerae]|uniref:hypothetical protein n=1 Tax=Allorhizocola rhizosphaerae TaxID=1872709 RepID=UPI000E3D03B2|nr:hypothetical protein [Allorhizocola rhizosphaerae]